MDKEIDVKVLDDETYDRLVAALVRPEGNPWTGEVTANEIAWILGEVAGVFPTRSNGKGEILSGLATSL